MRAAAAWLGCSLLLLACRRELSPPAPAAEVRADARAPTEASAQTVAHPPPDPKTRDAALEAEAGALLEAWESAQNLAAYERYESLYAQRFTGVRRSGPRTRSFDRAGWLKDRARMFQKPMKVHFESQSTVQSGNKVIVAGEQTFAQGSYQDRGLKRFVLAREAGALRIEREEMLGSVLGVGPDIAARFVVALPGGPSFALVAPAETGVQPGPLSRAAAQAYFGLASYEVAAADAERVSMLAASFLKEPVQLLGAEAACSTRAIGVRYVQAAFADFVSDDSGALPERHSEAEAKLAPKVVAEQLSRLGADAFWAVELAASCVSSPLVAVASARSIAPFSRETLAGQEKQVFDQRFASGGFVRSLAEQEREAVLGAVEHTRFVRDGVSWVFSQSADSCATPVVVALYDAAGKLVFGGDGAGLERVDAVADLDGDGLPELIGGAAIGYSPLVIRDVRGRERLRLGLPYLLCPC